MSTGPMVSTSQIAAQLDTVLQRDPDAVVVAIRAAIKGPWPDGLERRGRRFHLRWCESRLSIREALTEIERGERADTGLIVLTPLGDNDVPDDVAARLARSKVFQPKGWDIVRAMFSAQGTDARLGRYDWMPEVLIDSVDSEPVAPVASGFLDLDSAWRQVMQRTLMLADARPDAATLMRWGCRPDVSVLLGKLPPKALADVFEWMATQSGPAGALAVRCIAAGRPADAAPLGLVCDVVFASSAEGVAELAQAAVRLERYVGDQHVTVPEGREWATQAKRLLDHTPPDEGRAMLDRADALLRELRISNHAYLSEWLPSGLEQRLEWLARSLTVHASTPSETHLAEIEDATNLVLAHRLVDQQPLRIERVRMARRLARWLHRPQAPATTLEALAAQHADDSAFVDWARFRLLGGDELPSLSAAYAELRAQVARRRDQLSKAFAAGLAAQVREAKPLGRNVLPVEAVLERLVGPLAAMQPVLLLVIDGLSVSIFRELFERPERHGWTELQHQDSARPLLGMAAFPTVTEISRASLLCGRVCNGTAVNEKPGFATHLALVAQSPISHPPKLFHKGDLSVDGNLSSDVRSALANPSQKVVGVVYNAVDDHLSGPDQLHQRWSLDDLRLLLPLLREARDSRRILVVTADHGHMLEDGSAMLTGGQSDRWRAGAAAADAREVALAGDRVLTPDGAKQAVCLWSETARFTGRKNGYHGGASPAEVIVPLSVFAPSGVNVEGWSPAPPQQPDWWDLPLLAHVATKAAPAAKAPTRKPAPKAAGQGGLFGEDDLPVMPPATPAPRDWVAEVIASSVYASQRQLAARVALPDEQMTKLLYALDERGGKLSRAALAQRLGVPELRLGGLLSAARRMLNVDQVPVMVVEEASGMVELQRVLLLQQFRIASLGGG